MSLDLTEDWRQWTQQLEAELEEILTPLGREGDNYGFALAVPEDVGSAAMMFAVGKESNLVGEKPKSLIWRERRYSPLEWVENWSAVPRATDALQTLVEKWQSCAAAESLANEEFDEAHDRFITECATASLEAMQHCNRRGNFGGIWYKVLFMSDSIHPVLVQAFQELNTGRALKEAAIFFEE